MFVEYRVKWFSDLGEVACLRGWMNSNRVGGGLSPSVPPHHRTYVLRITAVSSNVLTDHGCSAKVLLLFAYEGFSATFVTQFDSVVPV